jgi:hypothetical protein
MLLGTSLFVIGIIGSQKGGGDFFAWLIVIGVLIFVGFEGIKNFIKAVFR